MNIISDVLDGRRVKLYVCDQSQAPVVYLNMYVQDGREIMDLCSQMGCPPFHLVTFEDISWDEDLSPWACAPVVDASDHFTGQAPEYLAFIVNTVMPHVRMAIPSTTDQVIAGYSMGGLFALWSLFQTDAFDRSVCVSGSVWFPGFADYFTGNPFAGDVKSIFLSVGSRESETRNPYLQRTKEIFELIYEDCQKRHVDSTFQIMPGNHFQHAAERVAKGITWTLTQPDASTAS